MSLHCFECKQELVNGVKSSAPKCSTLLLLITPAETTPSPPEDEDMKALLAASVSHGSAASTSVTQDFPKVMTIWVVLGSR